jgi:hypothetical protein
LVTPTQHLLHNQQLVQLHNLLTVLLRQHLLLDLLLRLLPRNFLRLRHVVLTSWLTYRPSS